MSQHYTRVYCYKIITWDQEDSVIAAAQSAGGRLGYYRESLYAYVYMPETSAHSLFFLQWQDHLEYVSWSSY